MSRQLSFLPLSADENGDQLDLLEAVAEAIAAPAVQVIRIRPNGKIDVQVGATRVALAPDLSLLAGRYLTDAELAQVRAILSR